MGGYSPAQDWARARRGGGGASLGDLRSFAGGAYVLRAGPALGARAQARAAGGG